MITVLIVDDHTLVRQGLKQILAETHDIVVTGEAQNGQEAIRQVQQNDYDVILLDIAMPGQDGLSVLEVLNETKPNLKVLVLSMYPEEQFAVRFLKAGASGYLTKESASDELIHAIHRVAQGGRYVTLAMAERLAFALGPHATKAPHELLSDREFQVMQLIAGGKSTTEIAEQLGISVKTVSTYRARILEKLGQRTTAELIHYAITQRLA